MRLLSALILVTCSLQAQWDGLVKRYVNSSALVDYEGWKQHDLVALDAFLAEVAQVRHESIVSSFFDPSVGGKFCRLNRRFPKQRCSVDLPS